MQITGLICLQNDLASHPMFAIKGQVVHRKKKASYFLVARTVRRSVTVAVTHDQALSTRCAESKTQSYLT